MKKIFLLSKLLLTAIFCRWSFMISHFYRVSPSHFISFIVHNAVWPCITQIPPAKEKQKHQEKINFTFPAITLQFLMLQTCLSTPISSVCTGLGTCFFFLLPIVLNTHPDFTLHMTSFLHRLHKVPIESSPVTDFYKIWTMLNTLEWTNFHWKCFNLLLGQEIAIFWASP